MPSGSAASCARAASSISGVASVPVTRAPARARAREAIPDRSRRRAPPARARRRRGGRSPPSRRCAGPFRTAAARRTTGRRRTSRGAPPRLLARLERRDLRRHPPPPPQTPRAARPRPGGAAPSPTSSTSAASPTRTATGSATSPASASRLPYLAGLGVDAIWVNPWYPSPQADGGYDVADYRDIDPRVRHARRGRRAHRGGARARAAGAARHRAEPHLRRAPVVRGRARRRARVAGARPVRLPPGRGPGRRRSRRTTGARCSAARRGTRVTEPDGTPGEWYLHLFDPKQPDLNWDNPRGPARSSSTSCGSGSTAASTASGSTSPTGWSSRPGCPTSGTTRSTCSTPPDRADHPHWDRPEVHDIYREWRALADSYDPPRVFVAEAWVAIAGAAGRLPAARRAAHRLRLRLRARAVGRAGAAADREASLAAHDSVGAPVTWVLSNHDITRHVTRLGRPQPKGAVQVFGTAARGAGRTSSSAAGAPGPRCCSSSRCPGGVYLYQGEELGLEEVEDLPEELLQDPTWVRSGHTERGRDGCRVPLPWTTSGPVARLRRRRRRGCRSPRAGRSSRWRRRSGDPDSMLTLYRRALQLRRELPALGAGTGRDVHWLDLGSDVVAFSREPRFTVRGQRGHRAAAAAVGRGAAGQRPGVRRRRAAARHGRLAAHPLTHPLTPRSPPTRPRHPAPSVHCPAWRGSAQRRGSPSGRWARGCSVLSVTPAESKVATSRRAARRPARAGSASTAPVPSPSRRSRSSSGRRPEGVEREPVPGLGRAVPGDAGVDGGGRERGRDERGGAGDDAVEHHRDTPGRGRAERRSRRARRARGRRPRRARRPGRPRRAWAVPRQARGATTSTLRAASRRRRRCRGR